MLIFALHSLSKEEKMKTNLNRIIRERKKTIYSSLTTTIEETMKPCYDSKTEDHYRHINTLLHIFVVQHFYVNMFLFYVEAKRIGGKGSLNKMRETIEEHVHLSKDVMFAQAKDAMTTQLRYLTVCHILYFVIQK